MEKEICYFSLAGVLKPIRIQGAYVSDKEVENIVTFLREQGGATYNEEVLDKIETNNSKSNQAIEGDEDELDSFLDEAIETVVETRTGFRIIYTKEI